MPPKAAATDITDTSMKFLFSVLKNCDEVKPNWQAVADENSISYARNAAARFKDVLKKLDYKFENGKIVEATATNGDASAAPVTPKKPIVAKKNGTTSNKKRKLSDVKVEEAAEEEDANIKDEDGVDDEETV